MKKAFSLIELLVVMVILLILSLIAVPLYHKYVVFSQYGVLKSTLSSARVWAESVVADVDRFPNGVCDASDKEGEGEVKCLYDYDSDTITIDSRGDLAINIPLKVTFTRNNANPTCGKIVVECEKGKCFGLKSSDGSGNAKVCIDTCLAVSQVGEDTNYNGVVNGGCD